MSNEKDCVMGNVNGLAIMKNGRLVDVAELEKRIENLEFELSEADYRIRELCLELSVKED